MYAYYLARKGYRVSQAQDGEDGLEKAFGLLPDLIVLDLWMPKKTGFEVVQRLKADERTKKIPVVVVSGHSSARALGCEGMLTKPFALEQLGAKIAKIFKNVGGKRPSSELLRKTHPDDSDDSPDCIPTVPDPVTN